MFKIESYITPVILSYVEKYVKNFKPEQSQVSLWGGDASFQNLDLRLEVLEEQLNLPFTFVSGHIHELIIHVPWVKITSEPIVVTINTIECILNLKDQAQSERSSAAQQGAGVKQIPVESPSSYIKSIVTKVINNITINCNNLILKYVEEDIVLSVNVRFLSMQTVNEAWEPVFADVSSSEVTLRKIIAVEDLTLCLDKMDTAGKIEVYQDPVLYRCSMMIRLMMNYHSNSTKFASVTRFDLHCEKMEFSMTEQQLPMLLRLITLITSPRTKQPSVRTEKLINTTEERGENSQDVEGEIRELLAEGATWSGWAWNTVTSILPVGWDPDADDENQVSPTGHIIHMSVFIDEAVLTFKTVEALQEQLFYKSRKIRYNSFLMIRVTSAVASMLVKGVDFSNLRFGLGSIRLEPQGPCSCGYQEIVDYMQPPIYIEAGKINNDCLKDSLFDKDSNESTRSRSYYDEYNLEYHLATVNATSMLEKSPAFGMDVVHSIEIPEDFPEEKLHEFESNFEYSNFPERKITRYVVGDLKIQLCKGFMHRIQAVQNVAKNGYNFNVTKKIDPNFEGLPPVTVEEYEALRETVSMVETYFNVHHFSIKFLLTDHSIAKPTDTQPLSQIKFGLSDSEYSQNPYVSLELSKIEGSIVEPMYPFRLASCASRQKDIAPEMLKDCYVNINVTVSEIQSQLHLNKSCRTTIVMPSNVVLIRNSLIYPQYWRQKNINHDLTELVIDDMTFTGTKAKLMVAVHIVMSIVDPTDLSNPLFCSSLFTDACNKRDPVYLELSLENVECKRIKSLSTTSVKTNVKSVKAFALNDTQLALILSGPESDTDREEESSTLFTAIFQYSETDQEQTNPLIVSFKVSEMRGSFDPLLSQWLQYQATYKKSTQVSVTRPEAEAPVAEDTFSDTDVRKKIFRSLHESVHSLSDKEKRRSSSRTEWSKGISGVEESVKKNPVNDDNDIEETPKSGFLVRIAQMYPFWRKLVLSGTIGHFIIYLPTTTMDGIGVAGIESAKTRALNTIADLHIIAIKCPTVTVHSVNSQFEKLAPHLHELPVDLPAALWSADYHSFPCTLKLNNLSCCTLKKNSRTNFIRKLDFTATIDVTTKSDVTESTDYSHAGLGLCIYVDTSPITVSLSEEQIAVLKKILAKFSELMSVYSCEEKISEPALNEAEACYFEIPKTPSSYNPVVYPENTTSPSSISTARDSSDQVETENPVITAMIQWTITKISVKLYTVDQLDNKPMKLLLELEDIITTLDWQSIYLKFKNKITTATVCHFSKESLEDPWKLGSYAGLILLGRESSLESEDIGFSSVTYTKAQSGNVHTRWGAQKHHKLQKIRSKRECPLSTDGYITEIDMNLQRVDLILPPSVLNKFITLLTPFVEPSSPKKKKTCSNDDNRPLLRCDNFENKCLPLVYLEFKGMNLVLPTSEDSQEKLNHDLLMIQLDGISVTPSTENPICRTILRSDIYQLAAQSNILNIPGSSVEDRQYQIIVRGICACTTTWQNYQENVPKRTSQSFLYTMNENPALEWNNLASDSNIEMQNSTSILMSSIDLRLIVAPAVILHPSKIICGGAFEFTCLTNIDLAANLDQIKLMWRIWDGMYNFFFDSSNNNESQSRQTETGESPLPIFSNSHEIQSVHVIKDQEADFAADSGIDFESSIANYASARKIIPGKDPAPLPLEILINCGSIAITLNASKIAQTEDKADASDVEKTTEFPFFYLTLVEPNVYVSQLNEKERMRISCFDIAVSLGNNDSDANQSKLPLIETKSGSPHPDTGIPPSFLTVKSEKSYNTSTELFIDVGRPTKINFSLLAMRNIDLIREQVKRCFGDEHSSENVARVSSKKVKNVENSETPMKFNLPELGFKTKQLVFCLVTSSGLNVLTSVARCSGKIMRAVKSEKIHGNLRLETLIVSAQDNDEIKTLFNPSSFDIAVSLFWETWQSSNDEPQIKIQAYSEAVRFELGPRQAQMLRNLIDEYQHFLNHSKVQSDNSTDKNEINREVAEQNYKDDLKAGAFQFVNGHYEEMPSPYQVIFYMYPEKGMAWKYPQPRMITGLHVSPIPFEISDEVDLEEEPLTCSLEYWSESHRGYRSYVEFELLERDNRQVDLPKLSRGQAVSSTWRVLMKSRRSERETVDCNVGTLAPQVLVGCLRIDSYFNAAIVPNVQISLNVGTCLISVMNQVNASTYEKLPEPLASFRLNRQIPENQCFLELEMRETSIVLNRWTNGAILIDAATNLNAKVLNYDFLHMDKMIEHLESSAQISLSDETNVSVECNPVTIKLGASIAHTLVLSTSLWLSLLDERDDPCIAAPLTRIVVANDSSSPIKFGQTETNDDYLLESRECHFFFWRCASDRTLRIAVYSSEWLWSERLSLQRDGKWAIRFPNSPGAPTMFAKVVSLTPTQKMIVVSGLLIVTNRLLEHVQMKLVNVGDKTDNRFVNSNDIYWINGYEQLPSIALQNVDNVAMRLRFASSANLAWTGDIPLKANSKFGQPWLVKVPLRERGQFLSIWVRIVEEMIYGEMRILVVISPLYMIKSYLPVPVVIKIKTPSLSTSSNATITGQGRAQQLYCPGTFEHCHQLTFQFESSTNASDPYVPLSYNSIEEKTFFSRPRHEDIDAILADLEKPEKASYLPFQTNHSNVKIPSDQPQTHVQIKYRDAGLVSSTLLLELQPWCFIFNTLGCQITLIAEDIELCQIPHNGIVTPPKLEGTFHLRITIENNEYLSPALQLARPDWNPGFYMPRIQGLVPVEGSIQTPIECGSQLCVVTINSRMYEDMRIIRIMASHVISNFASQEFEVSCFAVGETSTAIQFPEKNTLPNFAISPKECENEGTPIVQWRIVDTKNALEHEALYISLRRDSFWSCPVRVDKRNTSRRSVAVIDSLQSSPLIITTQEDNGVTYILLHTDDHPQLHVENGCPFPVLLGEANENDGVCDETPHFDWTFRVNPGKSCYYSTPSYANRMPDSQTTETLPKLRLSVLSSSQSDSDTIAKTRIAWSKSISLSQVNNARLEHVRLPVHGDIKLLMEKRCHIIYLRIVNMSQVEVSVHDIRTRLIQEESKSPQNFRSQGSQERDLVNRASEILMSTVASQELDWRENTGETGETSFDKKTSEPSKSTKVLKGSLTLYMRGINVTIMQEINENSQRNEIASMSLSDVIVTSSSNEKALTLCACIGDLQLDNQMYDQGGYDFPVVFMSQNPYARTGRRFSIKTGSRNRLSEIESQGLIVVDCSWEVNAPVYACTKVNIKIGPVSAYIEDTFISQLLEYTTSTASPCLNVQSVNSKRKCLELFPDAVCIPEHILAESTNLRSPLRLERFTIEPISVLLSVHTSIRLYVALDHSPLYFGAFEKEHLFTTASGLANVLTMHYLSGALFGAGWVVGSLEILGSPGGFAQALGSGLKDFVTLPIQGILNGPWSFLTGITQGSASLVKHLTAGTVNSVTKLASSVARNLDRLTLDNEHLQRQEESRRTRPQGMAQGLYQGLTGFGMSLLGAVAGLAHHPLQQVLSGEMTPRGLVAGVGLGIVGAVTKPLSGAAELVALTGQGLLEGTGWNPLPTPRQRPTIENIRDCNNGLFKCVWRMLPLLGKSASRILYIADANYAICETVERRVVLILTRQSLILADMDEGSIEKIYSLKELTSVEHIPDPTVLCLYCPQNQNQPERSTSPIEYPEMDQAMRVRVEQFVRGSSSNFGTYQQSDTIELLQSNPNNTLTFYIEPAKRNYFVSLFEAAKRQEQLSDFIVL